MGLTYHILIRRTFRVMCIDLTITMSIKRFKNTAYILKVQNIKVMFLVIIFIGDLFCVLLPKQDITRKRRVYENAIRRTKMLLFCYIQERFDFAIYKNAIRSRHSWNLRPAIIRTLR